MPHEPPDRYEIGAVIVCFLVPPAAVWITLAWREVRRLGRERRALQTEAETEAAEGFPPPGPPTTDSQAL
jgi:hypothetical protein